MKVAVFFRELDKWQIPSLELLERELAAGGAELCIHGRDFTSWSDLPEDVGLFLSLGGDGTFLQALTYVRERQIPVAGINFGRLGFLTTAKVEEGRLGWVKDLLEGRYTTETRDILKISSDVLPVDFYPYAGNEITIQRQGAGMLTVDLKINGRPIPPYWADGIVIATATGSTAYSMSVGGPIVVPSSKVLIIAPIAPHNLNVRPLVAPVDSQFELRFRSREGRASLTLDNRSVEVKEGDVFRITKGEYGFRYVSLSENGFFNALRTKLLWGEDKRNFE
ncbi:MAG: NAD(+)/NADH kinase [Bacteroidales bacterium]|nr:NAD(+)/NADH kinase [Candidatus Cacconaster equi]